MVFESKHDFTYLHKYKCISTPICILTLEEICAHVHHSKHMPHVMFDLFVFNHFKNVIISS